MNAKEVRLMAVLEAIIQSLDAGRNRFGKVLIPDIEKREALIGFAKHYKVGPCADVVKQAVEVAKAALAEASVNTRKKH